MRDTLESLNVSDPEIVFFNTDYYGGEGIHWILLVIDPIRSTLLYYDPLGESYKKYEEIKTFAKKNNLRITEYKQKTQYIDSSSCGFHAMYVAKILNPILKKGDLSSSNFIKTIHNEIGGRPSFESNQKVLKYAVKNKLLY